MTSQDRLKILKGIEDRLKTMDDASDYALQEAKQLLNHLIMDELKSKQEETIATVRKADTN